MTKEAINQAMAGIEGWKLSESAGYRWTSPEGKRELKLPHEYTSNLNAVAQVVGKLTQSEQAAYRIELCRNCGMFESPIDATAAQRCEAILRACGKWVEA